MKSGIHPEYKQTTFTCSCGTSWNTMSTLGKETTVEICSICHPFYTGTGQRMIDSAGRIEKFKRRYKRA